MVRDSPRRTTRPYRPDRPTVPELAAGAALTSSLGREVLLLHHGSENRWCFPKGHVESGESLQTAARRELREETGIPRFQLRQELIEVSYRFFDPARSLNVQKTTVYFLATTRRQEAYPESLFDSFRWCSLPAARRLLPYDTDRRVIDAIPRAPRGASRVSRGS